MRPLTRWFRRHWLVMLAAFATLYFALHAIYGTHGILAWIDIERQLEQANGELTEARAHNDHKAAEAELLKEDRLHPDALEEELKKLGYVRRDEIVVLTPGEEP